MNRILEVNERNWYVEVEPGVTYALLQRATDKRGFRVASPLTCLPSTSVLTSYVEREPVVTAADFTYGNELIATFDIVLPSGQLFTVGHPALTGTPASAPDGPGLNFYRFFLGAQGTLGIVTKLTVRLLPMPVIHRAYFAGADSVGEAVHIIKAIQQHELGLECIAMNRFDLAAMLVDFTPEDTEYLRDGRYVGIDGAKPWSDSQLEQFASLKKRLPPWTVIVCLAGWGPLPTEKVAYQELDLNELGADNGFAFRGALGGIPVLDRQILDEFVRPWRFQKRFGYKGSCHALSFISPIGRVGEFEGVINAAACRHEYPLTDIGGLVIPIERARAFYCHFDLTCDPSDLDERVKTKTLLDDASAALVSRGAFFDRPYGPWAPLMFDRAGEYTIYLKKLKQQLDPNNIMNPGRLCF